MIKKLRVVQIGVSLGLATFSYYHLLQANPGTRAFSTIFSNPCLRYHAVMAFNGIGLLALLHHGWRKNSHN